MSVAGTGVIDAHHHLWRYTPGEYGWISPEMQVLRRNFLPADLIPAMQEAGTFGEDGTIQGLLELAAATPTMLGVVGWAPLTSPDLPQVLRGFAGKEKLKGLRHVIQDEPDDNYILRADFNVGVAQLADAGLAYDILIHARHLPQASEFVSRHPRQSFILDHCAKPDVRAGRLDPWRDNLDRLAEHPNVCCKLSGLVTEADWAAWTEEEITPVLDHALGAFGAERLMAGSDWPVCLLASSYKRWWQTLFGWAGSLAPEQQALVLGGNARRVYRLE